MVLPNQLTVARIVLTPVFVFFFLSESPLFKQISLAIFIIAALTDWYDGWLARKFNYITNWGKFWDPLADKILTSAAFLSFVVLGILSWWMVAIIILRDFVITILRSYADYKGQSFPTSRYAKWKTAYQMTFLYLLIAVYVGKFTPFVYSGNEEFYSRLLNPEILYYIMLSVTIITFHSGLTYLFSNRKLIQRLLKSET